MTVLIVAIPSFAHWFVFRIIKNVVTDTHSDNCSYAFILCMFVERISANYGNCIFA